MSSYIAAPLLVLTYGVLRIVDGLDGERGPGPAWTVGHLAFLAALGFFTWIFQDMVRRIGPRGRIFAVVAVAGAVALSGQFAVDVVAGFLAEDHAEMAAITRGVRTTPGISLYFYDFGPYLFYFGQLTLVVLLALGRHVRPWTPLLVLADLAMPFIDKDLIPLGAVLLLVSFAPLARKPVPVQDLYLDVMVPTDGRHQRLLDLDQFADAIEGGQVDVGTAVDGLRRWQWFLDSHLHAARDPRGQWTDFPPRRLRELAALPAPLGPVVIAPG